MKVVVLGAGLEGLVSSYILRQQGFDVTTIDCGHDRTPDSLGDYSYCSDDVKDFLEHLGVVYSDHPFKVGILLRGGVYHLSKYFKELDKDDTDRILSDYYKKTRFTEQIWKKEKAFPDPTVKKSTRLLRADFELVSKILRHKVDIIRSDFDTIFPSMILLKNGKVLQYDRLIFTVPLWTARGRTFWKIPSLLAVRSNMIAVSANTIDNVKYEQYQIVYTPYTPKNHIHRFTSLGESYMVEVNGKLSFQDLVSDLHFIFPGGWYVHEVWREYGGYLLPLDEKINWPQNIIPLGKYAQWDYKVTIDAIFSRAHKVLKKLNGEKNANG